MSVYFLEAIALLNKQEKAYAAAIIEFSMIDALAKYSTKKGVEKRIIKILKDDFAVTEEGLAERVCDEFRNGLLHENHIKNKGQLSYTAFPNIAFIIEKDCVIVNPKQLETELNTVFQSFIETLRKDEAAYNLFHERMTEDFADEIAFFKSL